MSFDINEFYAKASARARKLADELGVEFKEVDAVKIDTDTRERIRIMEEYEKNKEVYDKLIADALTVCTPEEIREFINSKLNPK